MSHTFYNLYIVHPWISAFVCCAINVVNRVNKEMHQILHNFVIYFSKTKISCKSVQRCEILILFTGGFRSWKFIWILYGDTTYQEISVLSTICVAREFRNIKTNSFRTRKKSLFFAKFKLYEEKIPNLINIDGLCGK